jgi:hypothetical protein
MCSRRSKWLVVFSPLPCFLTLNNFRAFSSEFPSFVVIKTGNVRSFFTTTSFYLPEVSKINKTFKYDSPIYKSLNTLIIDNPINEETQRKLEEFLLNYSYASFENKPTPV